MKKVLLNIVALIITCAFAISIPAALAEASGYNAAENTVMSVSKVATTKKPTIKKKNGKYYYYNKDGKRVTRSSWKKLSNTSYVYVGKKGYVTYKLYKKGSSLKYVRFNGKKFVKVTKYKNTIKKINGKYYDFNKSGNIVTKKGWRKINSKYYVYIGSKGYVTYKWKRNVLYQGTGLNKKVDNKNVILPDGKKYLFENGRIFDDGNTEEGHCYHNYGDYTVSWHVPDEYGWVDAGDSVYLCLGEPCLPEEFRGDNYNLGDVVADAQKHIERYVIFTDDREHLEHIAEHTDNCENSNYTVVTPKTWGVVKEAHYEDWIVGKKCSICGNIIYDKYIIKFLVVDKKDGVKLDATQERILVDGLKQYPELQ